MRLKRHLLSIAAAGGLAVAGLTIAAPTHVFAGTWPSGACSDNVTYPGGQEVHILSSPITLNAEVDATDGPSGGPYVFLCYATTPVGDPSPQAAGGIIQVTASSSGACAGAFSDPTSAVQVNNGICTPSAALPTVNTNPTYTIQPGGANGGQQITLSVPFDVCEGQCVSNPGSPPYATGLIVGTLSEQTGQGPGAAFVLSSLCVEVDQVQLPGCNSPVNVGGVTTTGNSPVDVGSLVGCGALVCEPSYIGLSGAQLATVYIPGTAIAFPVYGPGVCLIRSGPQPSPDPCTQ